MSMISSISSSLDSLSARIATINNPSCSDPARFVLIETELTALGEQITDTDDGRALVYLERFSAIQDQLRQAKELSLKKNGDFSGIGFRSVIPSSSSRLTGGSDPAPKFQTAPGIPMPLGAQRVLGTINQYHDGTFSPGTFGRFNRTTCPSTSLAFIAHFLNHGSAGLDSNKIDQLIRIGQDRFLAQITQREDVLNKLAIPPKIKQYVQGTMTAPTDMIQAFEDAVGPRPPSPKSFFLIDRDLLMEGKLTQALTQTILPNATRQKEGKIITPIKANVITFHALFEVSKDEIKSALCSPEGVLIPGTESCLPNTAEGIAATSKTLIGLMTTKSRKVQLAEFIKYLVPLAKKDPSRRVASTITINGQTTAIGIEVVGPLKNPTIRGTLFDSHGNAALNDRSGSGFVYQVEGVDATADVLLRMLCIHDKEIRIQEPLSQSELEMIQESIKELNEVGSCIILPKEKLVHFPEKAPVEVSEERDSRELPSSPPVSKEVEREVPIDQNLQFEKRLTDALSQRILPQAMKQLGGKILSPIKVRESTFHALFEVTNEIIKATLCSPEGVLIPGTENQFSNDEEGSARTSKALVALMNARSQK